MHQPERMGRRMRRNVHLFVPQLLFGAETFGLTTLGLTTLSIMRFSIKIECNAECRIFVMTSVVMLNVVIVSDIMLNIIIAYVLLC